MSTATVMRALDALAPMLEALLADASISAEHAMHLVVMDPAAEVKTTPFDDAILVERSFGDAASWQADYPWYAREKTRLAWREQMSLRTLFGQHPARLRDGDIRVEGAVRSGRWVVGASGAQPWYDHAIATIAIALLEAAVESAHPPGEPNPVMAQGARDIEQGKTDTDCYDAAGPRFDRKAPP
ncbi:MAG TPA: hypothetical protein VFO53_15335 [Casimicrobiaceae bacterium]|nr:hypothetical protein [Casimicrobiaceae bacterium]